MTETGLRVRIIEIAREWMGTPFHNEARVKGIGVDCLQLLIAVFTEVGLLPAGLEIESYPPDWHLHREEERYLQGVAKYGRQVDAPGPGDVALFKFGRCVSHAAIVIDWPLVIHAYHMQGVVEGDAVNGNELAGRLHSFWTLIESDT